MSKRIKSAFLDKLVERLDRLDPQSIQTHFLKLARERGLLETIFQSIQEGILVIDSLGRLSYANRAAEDMMGFNLVNTRGRPVSGFFHDIDWDLILTCDTDEWSKLVSREIEITYPQHRILSFYVVPMTGDGGEQDGAILMLRDVTRDREAESTHVETERLNAVKLLAAGVAHEIGNPLNALNIHLQLLEREVRNLPGAADEENAQAAEIRDLVTIAKNEVSRLDIIITQFLRAIRPASPRPERTRIDEVLKQTLTLLKEEIRNRRIEVELSCPGTVPIVMLDKDQMKQAFFNIIRNAFQAMPDGGSLRIAISASDRYLGVSFRDTGVGIDPSDLASIFEPYHTTKKEGSGLGLMIVQRIVQDHGGQIEVRSKPDEGTMVTLLLPLTEKRTRMLRAPAATGER